MNLLAASGRGICVCRFGFSRTGTAEAEPTIEPRSKLRGIIPKDIKIGETHALAEDGFNSPEQI